MQTSKARRQAAVLDLVRSGRARTQAELARALADDGHDATQATISRDIRELGLMRSGGRSGYLAPSDAEDRILPPQEGVLRRYVVGCIRVEFALVVKTPPGCAPLVARTLDQVAWPEVLGTIAGDDTVFLLCRDSGSAGVAELRLTGGGPETPH
ncbi:MAG: arginine repressor [Candidatus Dormibacteria bacterium]